MTSARYKLPRKLLVSTGWFQFIPSKMNTMLLHINFKQWTKKNTIFFVFQLSTKKLPGMFCVFFFRGFDVSSQPWGLPHHRPNQQMTYLRLRRIELQQNGHEHIQDPPSQRILFKEWTEPIFPKPLFSGKICMVFFSTYIHRVRFWPKTVGKSWGFTA